MDWALVLLILFIIVVFGGALLAHLPEILKNFTKWRSEVKEAWQKLKSQE